jgi:hypothetical protein
MFPAKTKNTGSVRSDKQAGVDICLPGSVFVLSLPLFLPLNYITYASVPDE